jgi:hypothetical protein
MRPVATAGEAPMNDAASVLAWDELAQELRRTTASGRVLVAVDGVDAAARLHFANMLARALRALGRAAVRLTVSPYTDDDTVRAFIHMFHADMLGTEFDHLPTDTIFIVDGWSLMRSTIRDGWQFTVFIESDQRPDDGICGRHLRYIREHAPREASDTVYNATDISSPLRVSADLC